MLKSVSKSILLAGAVALSAPVASIACSAQNSGAVAENVGTFEAALSTVGPDGATYTFESSAIFGINSATNNPNFNSIGFELNGSGNYTTSFPVGNYVGTISGGSTNDAGLTTFVLVRTSGDGGTSNVTGTLLDSGTYPFTITAGDTTSVVIHLSVPELGTLTFSTGTLTVGTSVIETDGGGSGAVLLGSGNVTSQTLTGSSAVQAALTTAIGSSFYYDAVVTFTSPWTPEVGEVCAVGSVQITSSTAATVGLATLIGELQGGTAEVCIQDSTSGGANIAIYRDGAAQTTALKAATFDSLGFQINSYGALGFQAYNDTNFYPQKLATPVTLSGFSASAYVWDETAGTTLSATNVTSSGSASTLVVTP